MRDGDEGDLDFVVEIWVVSPTWIEGIGVGVILQSVIEVIEGIGMFNGEILK